MGLGSQSGTNGSQLGATVRTTRFRTANTPDGPVVAVGDAHGWVHVINVQRGADVALYSPTNRHRSSASSPSAAGSPLAGT